MRHPTPFGKYLLLDRISVGGMAEVFRAKSYGVEGFERLLAIKRILPSMGEDRDFISMFIDEAKIAGQLSHPNIGQVFELGRAQDAHYIAMEYIWGKDLLQILNRCRKRGEVMPIGLACFVVAKVAEGLDYAHKKRDALGIPLEIVHRDCSPQNVLVSYEGEVKIIDFGIARAASRSSRTNAGVLKGKFGYMSPEQVRGLPLDHRSDIFALGTVFYEALTGDRLFQGESDFSTLEKVRNAEIRPPRELRADIPPEIERIVLHALARDPRQRYAACSEMLGDLMRFLTAQQTIFTAKGLGDWIRVMFADDLERDIRVMEGYRHLGRDGELLGEPKREASDPDVRRSSRDPGDYEEERPTEVLGEIDIAAIGATMRAGHGPTTREAAAVVVPATPSAGMSLLETASVQTSAIDAGVVHGLRNVGPVAALGSAPGFEPGSPEPMTAMPIGSSPGAPTPIGYEPARPVRPMTEGTMRRSRWPGGLGKEIGIAISIAGLVLAIVVTVRFMLVDKGGAHEPVPQASTGTIAVMIGDDQPAEVMVDGASVGVTTGREPLTVAASPGAHRVSVSRAGAPPCEKVADVTAGKVEFVNCALTAPVMGRLVLVGLSSENVVHVDGQEISPEAAREPIQLSPGNIHSITVSAGDRQVDRFDLKLSAGQAEEHVVASPSLTPPGLPDPNVPTERTHKPSKEAGTTPIDSPPTRPSRSPDRPTERVKAETPLAREAGGIGQLTAFTRPFARIYVDGRDTGKSTPIVAGSALNLSAGHHKVTFVVGDERHDFGVDIAAGKTSKLNKILDAPASTP